jgi:HPt (histidine-containing phosphotransfer) domain-containing protein
MKQRQILDRDHLARYTLGDADLELEVLQLFLDQMPQTLALLGESEDPHSRTRAAHTIKGSARAVGAWKLAEAAERAESSVNRCQGWDAIIADVVSAAAAVRGQIAALGGCKSSAVLTSATE